MLDHSSSYPTHVASDSLSEVLQDFRLNGVRYGRCDLRHPWSLSFPEQPLLRFHFVNAGACWIHTSAEGWQELQIGDLVFLPRGIEHKLASSPDVERDTLDSCRITPLGGNVCDVVQDGTGAASTLFSGAMALGADALNPVIALMPPIIRSCVVGGQDLVVQPLIAAMMEEVSQPQIGSATVLSRMADLLVARLIRCWVNRTGAETSGWLAAIRDPHIGRALVAMHRNPGQRWTVDTLAGVAGQSRSIFAERFSVMLGEGAAHYLARLRMQLARELLGQTMSVAAVASHLGYDSEASFSRAFKRVTGLSPGHVRRAQSGRTDMEFGF